MNSDLLTLGLCTETLLRWDIRSAGWGVYGVPGWASGEGEREWSEDDKTSLAGEVVFVGVARVGWGRLIRSERGDPRKGEEASLLLKARSRHFLDLEFIGVLMELSGVTMCFSPLLEPIV